MTQVTNDYNANSIEVLEGLDAVRLRPGMYIGSTGTRGLHHILWEIVDNAVDEAANGFATKVRVELHPDGSDDQVGKNGKGVTKLYNYYKDVGVKDLSLKLYEGGRHEMLNEVNRDEVYDDVLAFLDRVTASSEQTSV